MRRLVYCRLPPGYTFEWHKQGSMWHWDFRRLRTGERQPAYCLPLIKALYGGMECGRIFWEAWVDWHLAHGFQIIHEERCYLCRRDGSGHFIKLGYHVDDNLVIALGDDYYEAYLLELKQKFDITEEPLVEHLGVRYTLNLEAGYAKMAQPAQVGKVLAIFGMEHCSPKDSPVMSGPLPCAADCEERTEMSESFDMQEFVGHVSWLHLCTRPDVGMVLKVLSRFTTTFGDRSTCALRQASTAVPEGNHQSGPSVPDRVPAVLPVLH